MTFQLSQTDPIIAHAQDVARRNEAFFTRISQRPHSARLSPLAEIDDDCPELAEIIAHAHDVARRNRQFFERLPFRPAA